MPTRGAGHSIYDSTRRTLQESAVSQDDDFPPFSSGHRLPPRRSWARNRDLDVHPETSSISTAVSQLRRRVVDRLAAIRDSEFASNPHNPANRPGESPNHYLQSRTRQLADWDLQAEYEELLRDFQISDPSLFTPSTFSTLRFLEQERQFARSVAQANHLVSGRRDTPISNGSNTGNSNSNYDSPDRRRLAMPFSFNDEQDRRRHSRPNGAAARTPHRSTAPPAGDGDDDLGFAGLGAGDPFRNALERLPQNAFSPFSPPPYASNLSLSHFNVSSSGTGTSLRPHEHAEDNYRAKRRKIESDRIAPTFKGFRYGRYGQVEPGDLTMEIVSCDGGLFSNGSSYTYENILKNDKSVYCTKSSRCNIVLRHQGATSFCLKELIIKAPGSGNYSSPVREGMVFVAMNQDDLLTRTAQYQIPYAPPKYSRDHRPLAPIISIRHNEDGTVVTRTSSRSRRVFRMGGDDDDDDEEDDVGTAQIPPEFSTDGSPFNVTTVCSDDESDGGNPRAGIHRRAPNRIGALPFESDSSDDGNSIGHDEYGFDDVWAPASRRGGTRNMTLAEALRTYPGTTTATATTTAAATAATTTTTATQDIPRAGGRCELMAPHAKFYIEKDKSKCTIRFDPPVSGRFILLKMWSPNREGSNIDIQAVIAKGFAGPRYFPSVELR
ncbi:hypothetical protein SODALDRAFT_330090 [Sodiomyces alkalinus F11]|uniref:Regulator of chromosome condensation-like protein n=1 Tax=Sodiomyces alkalinus (strain CBS 110278 / VKM F-3762 / F11) TaxID=1314773 RepID=A0A3N2Q0V2_SODAK|nr:hypothetical protein SODALDRAFT_330090 [Sodiomyces alkalinus F11]ROT40372.1 hypothetical protein SODALDRAFT_330090 [Sodiomyces alkalinus F11]